MFNIFSPLKKPIIETGITIAITFTFLFIFFKGNSIKNIIALV